MLRKNLLISSFWVVLMPVSALPAMSWTGLANINCSSADGVCTADKYQTGAGGGMTPVLRSRGGRKVYFRVSGIQGRSDRNFTPARWPGGRSITLRQIEQMKDFGINANPPQSFFCVKDFFDRDVTSRDIIPNRVVARGGGVWSTMAKIDQSNKLPYCPTDPRAYKPKF